MCFVAGLEENPEKSAGADAECGAGKCLPRHKGEAKKEREEKTDFFVMVRVLMLKVEI